MRRIAVCVLAGALALAPAAVSASEPDPVDLACGVAEALGCTTYYTDVDGDGYGDPATAHRTPLRPEDEVTVGGDCHDTDPEVNPGAVESYDGRDEDCDGLVDEPVLLVAELMIDPHAVSDARGEYVEVRNASDEPVRLDGVEITVGTRACPLDGALGAGERLVAARSADGSLNGGVPTDVVCSVQLTNSGAVVRLVAPSGTLDAVDYTGWTVPTGASLGLREDAETPEANDDPGAWCRQTTPLPGGDAGTPGETNDPC